MTKSPYEYSATVERVVDGDTVYLKLEKTFEMDVDFGFGIIDHVSLRKNTTMDFRLFGINAPEMKTPDGPKAKAELERLLKLGSLRVISYKPDKYGRWLADIFVKPVGEVEIHVNKTLLDTGFARAYNP